jgi:mRNA interferase MazF
MVNQYEIYWVKLDPTRGSELKKTRPCIVISPNEMNHNINTVIIAPLTSTSKNYPTRIKVEFEGQEGWIIIDQIRCIDKSRLLKEAGCLVPDKIVEVKTVIKKMLVD